MNISGVNFTGGFVVSPAVDNQFNYVTALLHGDGVNAGQNNTFLDSSTNNFAITRTGSTTQGSYGPYGSLWSNFLNTGDKLTASASSAFDLSGSTWTIEFWMYSLATPTAGNECRMIMAGANGDAAGWSISNFNNGSIGFFRPYGGGPVGIATPASTIVLNNWYHVAVVCNAGSARIYINGTQAAGPVTISLPTSASQALRIGYDDVGTVNFQYNGYLSNLRIVKGTAVYTAAFTPPTAPLTAITNTSFLTCQSNRFRDNSTNNLTITPTGTPSVQVFSPFGATTQYYSSVIGASAYLNGSTDCLNTPSSSSFNFNTGAWTIEGWFYLSAFTSDDRLFTVVSSASSQYGIYVRSGTIYLGVFGVSEASIGTITRNIWTYLAFVKQSGSATVTCYVNGVSAGSTGAYTFPNTNCNLYIGGSPANYAQLTTKGYISDVRVVNGTALYTGTFTPPTTPLTAITNTQLLLNFTNSQIFDNAMMNNLVTVGNAQVSTSIYKYGTGSLYFDGTGDWLVPTNLLPLGSGDFTVEMWLYPNATYSGTYAGLLDSRTSADGAGLVYFGYTGTANQIGWKDNTTFVVTGTVTISTWNHVAIVRRSGTMTMYINGTSTSSAANSTNYTVAFRLIGSSFDPFSLNGYIDELRITNGIARYTSNFTAPTSQFPSTGPIPIATPTVEYLVVAGGGGGGATVAGGGGGGGFRTATGFAVSSGVGITVTVGGGGAGATSVSGTAGTTGNASVFSSISSAGGGGGGHWAGNPGLAGGSGGGGAGADSGPGAGGAGNTPSTSPAQGFAGGTGANGRLAGGGGGASAAGAAGGAVASTAGAGGAGSSSSISGTSTTYAGGGGGGADGSTRGTGGTGGGGTGGSATLSATAGTSNTGGGGGGGGNGNPNGNGFSGGSGIVIIRYTTTFSLATSTTGNPTVTTTGGYNIYTWTSSGSITF